MLYQLSYTRSRKSGQVNYRKKGWLQPCFSGFFEGMPPYQVGEHALERPGVAHLDECPPKIRPGLEVEEAGVQDGCPPAVGGAEVAASDALMLPNGLQ